MGTTLVVPADPLADRYPCLDEAGEVVLPDALLPEAADEALDHAVQLRREGGDELLGEAVVADGGAEATRREDHPVVPLDDRRQSRGPRGAEAGKAGLLQGAFGLAGPAPQTELPAHDLAVTAVDDRRQVTPAVLAAVDVCKVHRPAQIGGWGDAPTALPRGRGVHLALVHEPALRLEDAIHGLHVDEEGVGKAQEHPELAVAEGRMPGDELTDALDPYWLRPRAATGQMATSRWFSITWNTSYKFTVVQP